MDHTPGAGSTVPTIRAATRADVAALAPILASAFVDTSTFRWLQPDDRARAQLIPVTFDNLVKHLHPVTEGTEVAVMHRVVGGAVWAGPGRWKPAWWRNLRALPPVVRAVDRRVLQEYAARGRLLDNALKQSHPREPHWYLVALGVDPTTHGSGAGSDLVRSGLVRCLRDGLPAYLECTEDLVGFYEKLGFTVVQQITMPPDAPPQVGMRHP